LVGQVHLCFVLRWGFQWEAINMTGNLLKGYSHKEMNNYYCDCIRYWPFVLQLYSFCSLPRWLTGDAVLWACSGSLKANRPEGWSGCRLGDACGNFPYLITVSSSKCQSTVFLRWLRVVE